MNNINSNYNLNIQNSNLPKANMVQVNENQNANNNQNLKNNLPPEPQSSISPSLIFNKESLIMDNKTILKYMQNLLNLPESIDEFINQIKQEKINPKLFSILTKNMVNIKALNEFLNDNSKDAQMKLLRIMSESMKSGEDNKQLKEIFSTILAIQNSTNLNTNTLKEFLLLYLPLNFEAFRQEISPSNQSSDKETNTLNNKLNILFETINFTNIKAEIEEIENSIFITLYTIKEFPKDKFKSIMNEINKQSNQNLCLDFIEKNLDTKNSSIQNFKITSENFVSINCLLISHEVIKTIFKIDNDFITT